MDVVGRLHRAAQLVRVLTLVVALAAGTLVLALQQFDAAWGVAAFDEASTTVVTTERLGAP